MRREIVFDLETTGLKPEEGHRVVEIGAVELLDKVPSGKTFQTYLNPGREVPEEATKVHGLTTDFLQPFPTFPEKLQEFAAFVGRARLVAHNAPFDIGFLNHELELAKRAPVKSARVRDTLVLARQRFPGQRCSLDALLERFSFEGRKPGEGSHGALLDAQLLAQVYPKLLIKNKT